MSDAQNTPQHPRPVPTPTPEEMLEQQRRYVEHGGPEGAGGNPEPDVPEVADREDPAMKPIINNTGADGGPPTG